MMSCSAPAWDKKKLQSCILGSSWAQSLFCRRQGDGFDAAGCSEAGQPRLQDSTKTLSRSMDMQRFRPSATSGSVLLPGTGFQAGFA